jgi:hypothetical protein
VDSVEASVTEVTTAEVVGTVVRETVAWLVEEATTTVLEAELQSNPIE